jgi:acyl-coenzyme A thioesterase PaaI-like protein
MEPEEAALPDAFVSKGRVRLAEAVRHLVDATLTAEDASSEQLATAAEEVERIAAELHRRVALDTRPSGVRSRPETNHDDYLPRSPLVGVVSPLAPPIAYEERDGRLVARGVFHAAYEGPPGYVHGGWIALGFDEILGMANISSGHPGMTGRLSIRYRRPTPLHRPVLFEAWTDQVDGRRVVTRGTLTVDDSVTAEAEGLFVKLDLDKAVEYFGRHAYERRQVADPLP